MEHHRGSRSSWNQEEDDWRGSRSSWNQEADDGRHRHGSSSKAKKSGHRADFANYKCLIQRQTTRELEAAHAEYVEKLQAEHAEHVEKLQKSADSKVEDVMEHWDEGRFHRSPAGVGPVEEELRAGRASVGCREAGLLRRSEGLGC